ncbi:MAG: hypothetical protein JWR70_703 [Modestobacter sp.]|jgi:hypothetical protein|nr:hypothetical protein [Modestobacter sp.]
MCDVVPDEISVTGSGEGLEILQQEWERLPTVLRFALSRPEQTTFADLPTEHEFDYRAPAVALIRHEWPDSSIANRLAVDMVTHRIPVVVEPVHTFGLTGAGPHGGSAGAGRPSVQLTHSALAKVSTRVTPGTAGGSRVGVLDTGDGGRPGSMFDFVGGLARWTKADDTDGHGTAVAELILALNPAVTVTALRVITTARTTSHELLCGLSYALWCGQFDVLNASLSSQQVGGCPTVLGGSLDMVLQVCQSAGAKLPVLVAAAGNTTTGQGFGYPAQLPGSVIVQALDMSGQPASYNVQVLPPYQAVFATGGDAADPLGVLTRPDGSQEDLYGTSFAAAVVTAAVAA